MAMANPPPVARQRILWCDVPKMWPLALNCPLAFGRGTFKSYGEHSDAELLRTYGFVEMGRSNPNNVLVATQQELLEACRPSSIGNEAERLARVQNLLKPVYAIPASGVLPAELLTVVQVILMSQTDYQEFHDSDLQVLGKKFHARGSVHGQKVTVCLLGLLSKLKQRVATDPTGESDRAKLSRAVRSGELLVLQEVQCYILTHLAPVESRKRKAKAKVAAKKVSKSTSTATSSKDGG
ncbi:unnamed protein product [Cladocopium goreaui]|uniref:LINE-1 reverse transcriptase-like n=1 Tax=Cladocopium goreaui TaxID=2562237 RepID=A0A9P1D9R1_9DINO|nr:unnamed protein product [Cladocopium goreaui]